MMQTVRYATAAAIVAFSVSAADAPYLGKWKFNASKSQLAGSTFSMENTANGMIHLDIQGFAYDFKADGKEYPAPDGSMNTWKAVSANQYDVLSKLNGKVIAAYSFSANGNSGALKSSMKKPDGTSVDGTATYTRVSGGPGALGKWRATEVKAPAVMVELTANGDGISWKDDTGYAFSGKFDGKEFAPGGTMTGAKYALSLKKISDRSFELTTKIDGKPFV